MCPLQIINDIEPLTLTLHGVNTCLIHHPPKWKITWSAISQKPVKQKKQKKCSAKLHIFTSLCKFLGQNSKHSALQKISTLQGLFVPFACIGSGDHVRVLRLYTMNTLDTLWSIYCWDICTTCCYRIYVLLAQVLWLWDFLLLTQLWWVLLLECLSRECLVKCAHTVLCGDLYSCLCRR